MYNCILLHYSCSLIASHFYLCIWVNHCSIISQVIIYMKELKRLISILNLALFCSTLPVALLVVDLSPSHSCCFDLLRTSTRSARSFVLFNTSSRSARCRFVSVLIFVALVCSTPRVALLVVDLFRLSQPFLLCVEHLDSLLVVQLSLAAI